VTSLEWFAVGAWSWFVLLAVAGQFWPQAGRGKPAAQPLARFGANMLLTASDLLLAFLVPVSALLAAGLAGSAELGLLRQVSLPGWVQIALAFVLSDLLGYAIHRLAHEWPLFWRLHRVHHTDIELDVLTTYRQHPLASLAAGGLQAAGILTLGLDPVGVLIYQLVFALHNPLIHANLAWPVPQRITRFASWLFITPGQHSLHHSARRAETDSNFGQLLSVWDRLFGSLRFENRDHLEKMEIGLGERYAAGASSIISQLALPLAPPDGPREQPQQDRGNENH